MVRNIWITLFWITLFNFLSGLGIGVAVMTDNWAMVVILYAVWMVGFVMYALSEDRRGKWL